jgi:hypothetical protein
MATQTSGDLGLIKPNNGEYSDGWDVPNNANFDTIDTGTSYAIRSIQNASTASYPDTTAMDLSTSTIGSADGLKKKLDSLLSSSELPDDLTHVLNDRFVGTRQSVFEVIAQVERYLYWLAQGTEDTDSDHPDQLRNELAKRANRESNCILDDNLTIGIATDTPTAQPVGINPTPIDIEGKTYLLHRAKESATGALGASRGVAFLYFEPGEETLYSDGGSADGTFAKTGSVWNKFTSATVSDFSNARAGHLLRIGSKIVGDYNVGGDYIIDSISVGTITIKGGMPVDADEASLTGLQFSVIDPFAVTLNHIFEANVTTNYQDISPEFADVSSKAFIGEIHWDGAAVANSVVYRKLGKYDSGWLSVASLTNKPPSNMAITDVINHNIGPVFNRTKTTSVHSNLPKIRLFVGQKDTDGYLTDVQEYTFNPVLGDPGDDTLAFQRGWVGFCNRTYLNVGFGVKMPVSATPDWAVQRILKESAFLLNDPTDDASYITDPTDSYYRLIVSRS